MAEDDVYLPDQAIQHSVELDKFALSIAALAAFAVWEEWLNLIAGLWLILSPWLMGFQDSDAMAIDVAIGGIVAVLAAFEIWLAHGARPRVTSA